MMMAGVVGAPAGFLARITSLEREVSFLKQKVEDDALWKHILQQWVLDNFAFDIQGALLNRNQPFRHQQRHSMPNATVTNANQNQKFSHSLYAQSTSTTNKRKPVDGETYYSKRTVKVERTEPIRTRARLRGSMSYQEDEDSDDISPAGFLDTDNEQEQEHCFGGVMEDGMEVNVHPKDLIITPDFCEDDEAEDTANVSTCNNKQTKNLGGDDYQDAPEGGGDTSGEDSSGSSSEEELIRRTHRKMEWTLIGTYPNVETLKQQFNLREWGLSTKQKNDKGVKSYYYCKECRKHGPGRLLIRYKDEDSEVEVLKNHLEHDHSTKKRLTEEMKVEIFNLYKAGMNDSSKILAALKISKPHMRQPTVKQVCHILKPHRRQERQIKLKEKKKVAKEKEKLKSEINVEKKAAKRNNKNKIDHSTFGMGGSSLSTLFPFQSSQCSAGVTLQQQQHPSQFMSQQSEGVGGTGREFGGRPHTVLVGGGFPSQQLQQFYQQQQNSSFDPNNVHTNLSQLYQSNS